MVEKGGNSSISGKTTNSGLADILESLTAQQEKLDAIKEASLNDSVVSLNPEPTNEDSFK